MQDQTEINYAVMTEDELAILSQASDEEAYQEICNRYRYRLYETAMAMLFSHQQAQEAVNDVLQNIRHCLHEFKGESLFLTWICRKLMHHVLTNYKLPENSSEAETNDPKL